MGSRFAWMVSAQDKVFLKNAQLALTAILVFTAVKECVCMSKRKEITVSSRLHVEMKRFANFKRIKLGSVKLT